MLIFPTPTPHCLVISKISKITQPPPPLSPHKFRGMDTMVYGRVTCDLSVHYKITKKIDLFYVLLPLPTCFTQSFVWKKFLFFLSLCFQSFYSVNSSDMICRGVTGVPKKLVPSNKIVLSRLWNVLNLPNRLISELGKKNWIHVQKPKAYINKTFEKTKEVFSLKYVTTVMQ